MKFIVLQIYFFVKYVLVFLPLIPLLLPIVAAFSVIRPLIWLLAKIFRPDLQGFVADLNYVFTFGEKVNFPMNTIGICVINGQVPVESFRENFYNRIFALKTPNGELLYGGLKTFWTSFLGCPFWKEDINFELGNHVRIYDYTGGMALSSDPSQTQLEKVVGKLIKAPWTKGRSPWEMLLIQNYKGEGKTIVMTRIDHVLADGLSIYEMVKVITQSEWRLPGTKASEKTLTKMQRWSLALKAPYDLLRTALLVYGQRKLPSQKIISADEVIFSMSPDISVDTIKSIKNHFKVSYAAVIYTGVCGVIARALRNSRQKVPKRFVTSIVLPHGNHPGGLSIHVDIVLARWPLECNSAMEQLQKVEKSLEGIKSSTMVSLGSSLGKAAVFLPIRLLSRGALLLEKFANPVSVAHSNVPVTVGPDYYEGLEIVELTSASSPVFTVGMMISLCGVNGKQRASFCVNKNMFPSEDTARSMGSWFAEEIQSLVNTMT